MTKEKNTTKPATDAAPETVKVDDASKKEEVATPAAESDKKA